MMGIQIDGELTHRPQKRKKNRAVREIWDCLGGGMSIQIPLFISPVILGALIPCNLFLNVLESVRMLSFHSTLCNEEGKVIGCQRQ